MRIKIPCTVKPLRRRFCPIEAGVHRAWSGGLIVLHGYAFWGFTHEGFDACDCRTRRRPRPLLMANQELSIKERQGLVAVGDGPAIS